MEKRVTGLGGVFFKSADPQKLKEWYRDHLGFRTTDWGASFMWRDTDVSKKSLSRTEWSPFKASTDYFDPSHHPYMINYRVHNLEKLLEVLKRDGVEVMDKTEQFDFGKFGWILDPEKRKIELWEPFEGDLADETPPLWNERVTGLGGVFFRSEDTKKIREWYAKHLGVGDNSFRWRDRNTPEATMAAHTIWSPFKKDTTYFSPGEKSFMLNYRVKNLDELLMDLKDEGVQQTGGVEKYSYGKFAWIMDPENNKIELWEPVDDGFEKTG